MAANSMIVPPSEHSGGTITVVDPQGQEMKLSLRKFHVDVHIEDGFARTTIDQTYFNHTWQQLEGTFRFPLPADASLSRLAMYVNGTLMEGGMVERNHGRNVFEQIRHTRRDPALLEWVDGSTFQMRVFPLEPRQEKRIVLSYTQRLPRDYGKSLYRFPAGHSLDGVREWSTNIRVKQGAGSKWYSPSHLLTARTDDSDLIIEGREEYASLDRDLVVEFRDEERATSDRRTVWSQYEQDGFRYVMLRHRPELPSKQVARTKPRHWVFLVENSADRNAILAETQRQIVKVLLENTEHTDTFSMLRAGTQPDAFAAKGVECSLDNVAASLRFLNEVAPIGALDLGQALQGVKQQTASGRETWIVHLGTGIPVLGERDLTTLQRMLPADARYVGVAVGKRWSKTFMETAAQRTGGHTVQINPDEAVSWRAFDLLSTLNAPRMTEIAVTTDAKSDAKNPLFQSLVATMAHGQELAAIARFAVDVPLPGKLVVSGKVDGQPYTETLTIPGIQGAEKVFTASGHLPRTWARQEIDRLIALGADEHKAEITELSKRMYVISPFTSLLVLETEAMYAQFNVDRGRADHWAMYPAPAQIPVVVDNGPTQQSPLDIAKERLKLAEGRAKVAQSSYDRSVAERRPATDLQRFKRVVASEQAEVERISNELRRIEAANKAATDPVRVAWESVITRNEHWVRAPRRFGNYWGFRPSQWSDTSWFVSGGEVLDGIDFIGDRFDPRGVASFISTSRPSVQTSQHAFRYHGRYEFMTPEVEELFLNQHVVSHRLRLRNGISAAHSQGLSLVGAHFDGLSIADSEKMMNSDAVLVNIPAWDTFGTSADFGSSVVEPKFVITGLFNDFLTSNGDGTFFDWNPNLDQSGRTLRIDDENAWIERYIVPAVPNTVVSITRPVRSLPSYAPGMQSWPADRLAVVAKVLPHKPEVGDIDAEARRLIEKARAIGWQSIQIVSRKDRVDAWKSLVADGVGRFVLEREVSEGLKETTIHDGTTMWHLYPEIALGAERKTSRFHLPTIQSLIPWYVPAAEDMAVGADVKLVGPRTIRVSTRKTGSLPDGDKALSVKSNKTVHKQNERQRVIELLFAESGELAESRVVDLESKKVLKKQTIASDGTVRLYDTDDQLISDRQYVRRSVEAPALVPDTTNLVVLPLPYRSSSGVNVTVPVNLQTNAPDFAALSDGDALKLLGTYFAEGRGEELANLIDQRYTARGDHRIGLAVLLSSVAPHKPLVVSATKQHADSDLATFLAEYSRVSQNGGLNGTISISNHASPFLKRLAQLNNHLSIWLTDWDRSVQDMENNLKSTLEFARECRTLEFAYYVIEAAKASMVRMQRLDARAAKSLADAVAAIAEHQDRPSFFRQDRINWYMLIGNERATSKATQLLKQEFADAIDAGNPLPLSTEIHDAFVKHYKTPTNQPCEPWGSLVLEAARSLQEEGRPVELVTVARRCLQLNEPGLAESIFQLAIIDQDLAANRELNLSALQYSKETKNWTLAEECVQRALTNVKKVEESKLLRDAAEIARQREKFVDWIKYLDKAYQIEFADLPKSINLDSFRQDYGKLFEQFELRTAQLMDAETPEKLAFAMILQKAATRWRDIDVNDTDVCFRTARMLTKLGLPTAAWNYWTTPLADLPDQSTTWYLFAVAMAGEERFTVADRAWATAFECEPTNPELLVNHAKFLRSIMQESRARELLNRVVNESWQPRFDGTKLQAQELLNEQKKP
ncbi:MAG: VIT and VWA domain-containing protein [Planctomycetaceae bacterium]